MRRRAFITLLGGAAGAWAHAIGDATNSARSIANSQAASAYASPDYAYPNAAAGS
jgi:hypothetical protein